MAVERMQRADGRRAGCDERCQAVSAVWSRRYGQLDLVLHDPDAHEAYGRTQSGPLREPIVRTGVLEVDLNGWRVWVDGQEQRLFGNGMRLLRVLAENAGSVVAYKQIGEAVWCENWFSEPVRLVHALRVEMSRLRVTLGPRASGLIRTVVGTGFVLDVVPIGESRALSPAQGAGLLRQDGVRTSGSARSGGTTPSRVRLGR